MKGLHSAVWYGRGSRVQSLIARSRIRTWLSHKTRKEEADGARRIERARERERVDRERQRERGRERERERQREEECARARERKRTRTCFV